MENSIYVGIDIAKDKFDAVIFCPKANDFQHKIFDNKHTGFKRLSAWVKKYDAKHTKYCMEATGHYGVPLAEYLIEQNQFVSVVNPFKIKCFARSGLVRNKTDKLDAKIISQYASRTELKKFKPSTAEHKALREWVRLREQLKKDVTALKLQHQVTSVSEVKATYKQTIATFEKKITAIDKKIKALLKVTPELGEKVDLLCSIKGIGFITATIILAYMPDIDDFDNPKQLAAFMGVTPRQRQSGKYQGKSKMSKIGDANLRRALFFPALSCKRCNPHLKPFIQRLEKNNKSNKTIVGALMRKLAHIIFAILKYKTPYNGALV